MTPLAQEKMLLSHRLKGGEGGLLREIGTALRDEKSQAILAALLENEAKNDEPLAYTELMKRLGIESNALAASLKKLRRASLVRQLTPLPLEEATAETGYRSFYRTTALALMILRAVGNLSSSE